MSELPPSLRAEIARTLDVVRPLAPPARRAATLLPLGALLVGGVPLLWGLRDDAAVVGALRLWGGSAFQVGVALAVLAGALAESVPGRLPPLGRLATRAALGLGLMLALTGLTFLASPTHVPPFGDALYRRTCLTRSFALGLLPLAAAGMLLRRGLTARPVVAGAVAGLGSGLLADSGWRLYCEVSDPVHVLTSHAVAIAALTLLGALAGILAGRRPGARP
jgi:hypothetical protein